jgi:hypothetical protein
VLLNNCSKFGVQTLLIAFNFILPLTVRLCACGVEFSVLSSVCCFTQPRQRFRQACLDPLDVLDIALYCAITKLWIGRGEQTSQIAE